MIPALTDQKFQRHTSSPSHITNMTDSSYWLSHIEGNEVIEGVCGETRHDGCKYFATQSDFSTWTPQIWCWLGYLFVYLCGKPWLSIYEISPKAAQRVTKQDPKSVTEAWLCNAAQSSRTNPILRVGFLLFFKLFSPTGGHNRRTALTLHQNTDRHTTSLSPWERLSTTIAQCSTPGRHCLTPQSHETFLQIPFLFFP